MRVTLHDMHHTPATPYLIFSYATQSCALSLPSCPSPHSVDLVFYLPILPSFHLSSFLLSVIICCISTVSVCLSLSCPILAIQGSEGAFSLRIFRLCHSKNVKTSFLLVIVQKEAKGYVRRTVFIMKSEKEISDYLLKEMTIKRHSKSADILLSN